MDNNLYKICRGNAEIHPSETHIVNSINVDEFESFIINVKENNIKDNIIETYNCLRNTGFIDSYLKLLFEKGKDKYQTAAGAETGFIKYIVSEDLNEDKNLNVDLLNDILDKYKNRISNIRYIRSLLDEDSRELDDERYGIFEYVLNSMYISIEEIGFYPNDFIDKDESDTADTSD